MNKIKLKLINILLLSIILFGITILSNTFYTAIKVEGSETFSCPIHYTSLSLDLEKSTETCHKYYCELCSQYYEEDHNFEDGKCSICNYKCTHKSGYTLDGKCSICGSICPFSITYNLDGGTLENFVSTYYYTSSEIVLSSPTKDGFRFLGWYDNSLFDGNTLTTIPTHSLGNKEVYASWYELESIVVDETLQVSTYDGKEKEFSILGSFSSLDGFYIEYSKTTLNSFSSILPKTAGIYDVKITRNQDDYYLQFNKVIEGGLVINKAVASIDTSGVIKDYTYNDEFQTVDSGAKLNHNETTLKYLNNTFINVGTGKYIITIKAEETENFLPIEKQVEITVKKLKVEEPIVIGEYIYTGETQYVVLYGKKPFMKTNDFLYKTSVGKYYIYFTLDGNHEWAAGSDGRIMWEIKDNSAVNKKDDKGKIQTDEKVLVEINGEFSSSLEVKVEYTSEEEVPNKQFTIDYFNIQDTDLKLNDNERIGAIYDVKLFRNEDNQRHEINISELEPGTKLNVKMRLPSDLDISKVTRILHTLSTGITEELAFDASNIDSDGYYCLEVDSLNEFVFVYAKSDDIPTWFILILIVIIFFVIYILLFIFWKLEYDKTPEELRDKRKLKFLDMLFYPIKNLIS